MYKFRLPRKLKKVYKKTNKYGKYKMRISRAEWEWLYFRRRVEVRCIEIVAEYPKILSSDELLAWYKKYYPDDKESQMYARQNVNKWLKYN